MPARRAVVVGSDTMSVLPPPDPSPQAASEIIEREEARRGDDVHVGTSRLQVDLCNEGTQTVATEGIAANLNALTGAPFHPLSQRQRPLCTS